VSSGISDFWCTPTVEDFLFVVIVSRGDSLGQQLEAVRSGANLLKRTAKLLII